MTIGRIDHVNISTSDLAATVAFFRDMLGLTPAPPPGMDPALNSWMVDDAGNALVHVNTREAVSEPGPINHVAFACSGYDDYAARLRGAGHEIRESDLRDIAGVRQIFVFGPEGTRIELNFREPPAP
ncbi:VOC family protein [Croceicoccus marinus]|jgi:catechol 2,3-dioxygenase-like lactoylglutathione lyase family enzyme|uniref:VOC family protein n=1 Tax=Croceicoccus marinus TaxID=450378 RepID=A0A7G6VUM5_9SPHN|nr:VOC family protein [Croceicoccus marinus]QNE05440.1 VOC family protein [Croceicoccus marinus]